MKATKNFFSGKWASFCGLRKTHVFKQLQNNVKEWKIIVGRYFFISRRYLFFSHSRGEKFEL